MWWQLLRYPSGDAQAQVFWRRRLSVLAVVAILLLLMLALLFRGGGGADSVTPASAEQPAPVGAAASGAEGAPAAPPASPPASAAAVAAPSASAVPSSSASPAAAPADRATTCAAGSMALRVAGDAPTYEAGAQPVITLSVVDVGTQPCTVDLGTTSTSLSVLSAGKAVWTSTACAKKVARPTQLTPATAQVLQLSWDRTRNVDGCSAPAPLPAGQYEIVARVGNSAVYGGSLVLR